VQDTDCETLQNECSHMGKGTVDFVADNEQKQKDSLSHIVGDRSFDSYRSNVLDLRQGIPSIPSSIE